AVYKLQRNVSVLRADVRVYEVGDVWTAEFLQDSCLFPEPILNRFVTEQILAQYFQRDVLPRRQVSRSIDAAHAAFAQQLLQLKASDATAGRRLLDSRNRRWLSCTRLKRAPR